MRKILFSFLLATAAATPALADPSTAEQRAQAIEDRHAARQEARAERQQSHEEARPEAAVRSQPSFQPGRPNFAPPANAQFEGRANVDRQQWTRPAEAPQVAQPSDRHGSDSQRQWTRPSRNPEQAPSGFDSRVNADSVANWRQQQRGDMRQERYSRNAEGGYGRTAPSYARPDRPAPVPQTAYNYDQRRSPQWSTEWRHDRRYNWRDYREHHRSVFRIGVYYDPFGWGYQRFNVGWRLYPAYYGQSYWLDDPYMYDLPYAPWPYKWVRYYNDALLVNVFSGQVEDVIYDFFW